jgi:hypothetical protein
VATYYPLHHKVLVWLFVKLYQLCNIPFDFIRQIASATNSSALSNGNQIAYIYLVSYTFHRQFPNVLDTSAVAALPDTQACTGMFLSSGSDKVRDMREAANYRDDNCWRLVA